MPRSLALLPVLVLSAAPAMAAQVSGADWPAYARTNASDRFAPQTEITPANAAGLRQVCSYDVGEQTSFQTGPLVIGGTLYGTTEKSTFAIDASTCAQKWKTTESYTTKNPLKVNRGAAYLDNRLFRGTQDGRVLAYDARSGRRLWETTIADPGKGESVPAAPLAWNDRVFVGNAGGDAKGVKGRIYALDAATGRILWEQYLVPREASDAPRGPSAPAVTIPKRETWRNAADVPITGAGTWTSYTLDEASGELYVPGGNAAPDFAADLRPGSNLLANSVAVLDARTGAYKRHFAIAPGDFHDWDMASAPALFTARDGRRMMAAAPKDGHLYGYDLAAGKRLYRMPVTTIYNAAAKLTAAGTRFCPGTQGGVEWNGPAYSSMTGLIYTGAVDWCTTVKIAPTAKIKAIASGQPWSGMDTTDPKEGYGRFDLPGKWAGWVTATDAETGAKRWQVRTAAPVLGGVTPTAGGVVFAGDMGGTLLAFDAASGVKLWTSKTGGAIGGGIISYAVGGAQRVAVASGMVSAIWPTPKVNARVIVYGLASR